jgi:AbiV family abortive infection protein
MFLDEASLLIENHYLRHSVGLIELAAEEIGKATHILDIMGDATILRKRVVNVDPTMFRKHTAKLKASPIGGLNEQTKRERRLHKVLIRFMSSGSILRQRSFYVDLRRNWRWGSPRLERKNILWYVINELGVTIDYLKDMAATVRRTNRMIELRGFDDKRVQELVRGDPYMKEVYESIRPNLIDVDSVSVSKSSPD